MKNKKIREILLGKALDPMKTETRHSMALVAFLAWVQCADGLSSSAYGPEETFRALGGHNELGLYLAVATAVTVFIIALAYNQVIELLPTGGGGYRVATSLVGRHFKNFLFVNARTVDSHAYGGIGALEKMREEAALRWNFSSIFARATAWRPPRTSASAPMPWTR